MWKYGSLFDLIVEIVSRKFVLVKDGYVWHEFQTATSGRTVHDSTR